MFHSNNLLTLKVELVMITIAIHVKRCAVTTQTISTNVPYRKLTVPAAAEEEGRGNSCLIERSNTYKALRAV